LVVCKAQNIDLNRYSCTTLANLADNQWLVEQTLGIPGINKHMLNYIITLKKSVEDVFNYNFLAVKENICPVLKVLMKFALHFKSKCFKAYSTPVFTPL